MSDDPLPVVARAPRWWPLAGRAARILGSLSVAACGLVLLAWLALQWAILPHIERWRPLIETKTSQALGVPVRIGAIAARSGSFGAVLEMRDVALLDAQLEPALQLPHAVASISLRSLLTSIATRELRLAQLVIDGAQLDVRRDAEGRLFVAGIDFGGAQRDGTADAADWFFKQHEFVIRGGTLRWRDERRDAPPLELAAVDIVVRNALHRHAFRVDATPPSATGERFTLRGEFTQPLLAQPGNWRTWSGRIYVDLPRIDASALARDIDVPFDLDRGVGAARAWIDIRDGTPHGLTADLALRAVSLRLGEKIEPLAVRELQGRFIGTREPGAASAGLRGFTLVTGDGVRWSPGDLDMRWTQDADGTLTGGAFKTERLDLGVVAQTARRIPLGTELRELLAQLDPQGQATDVEASWEGAIDAPTRYRVAAALDGVSLAAGDAGAGVARPGVRNATLKFAATEAGGQASLAVKDGAIELPGVFEEPTLPFSEFSGQLNWRIDTRPGQPHAIEVKLSHGRVANADARGEVSATWRSGDAAQGAAATKGEQAARAPGALDLDATLTNAVATRVARYLPLAMPQAARDYVQHAVVGGTLQSVSFRIRGQLADFPFHDRRSGEFRVAIETDDLSFAYAPGSDGAASPWPALERAQGEIVIDRGALSFEAARGQLLGLDLTDLKGGIADLFGRRVLALQAHAQGPVADVLKIINTTPAGDRLDGALREMSAGGNGKFALALELPLQNPASVVASGSVKLDGSDVRLRPDMPVLGEVRGQLDFNDKGFMLTAMKAKVLGGDTVVNGGTQADASLRIVAQGSASVDALRHASEWPVLSRLAASLSGQARYRLALVRPPAGPQEISLTSDLVGAASTLPAPLAKTADTALPLRVQLTLVPRAAAAAGGTGGAGGTGSGAQPDRLRVELGKVVEAQYQFETSGSETSVLRGGIGMFVPAPTPERGVAAQISLKALDLDAWQAATQELLYATPGTAGAPAASGFVPTQIGLEVQELRVSGRTLTRVTAGISQFEGQWRATLDADQLAGYVEYGAHGVDAQGPAALEGGHVRARLSRLNVPKAEVEEVTHLLEQSPASLPSLDILVEDFELRGRHLGSLEVKAVNRQKPVREWVLTRLHLGLPEAGLNATGRWAEVRAGPGSGERRAEFDFVLDLEDSGAFLDRTGTPGVVRGGKGSLKGTVGWLGSPFAMDYPSMTGDVTVAIGSGQFLQAQPGAARLLGVLSLQSLARRLTFDFRDVFLEGFAFDSIIGDVKIDAGVASTDKLVVSGALATVLMQGSADLAHETQDLRIIVVPELNVEAASLAVAVINPAIGLGTLLAQMLLREPMIEASTREFRVTGSWADPVVEPVARRGAVPAPSGPASAASGASGASSPAR
ncbi:MAG: TIGR02099 family protein [Burkholderiaceae bacterium]|nr:TIGR02099 family protein [Burkholderiaceae bacterium]